MLSNRKDQLIVLAFLIAITFAFVRIHFGFVATGEGFSKSRDVYFIFQDAKLLAEGQNPYARIADGDLTKNRKYTFYLPAFLLGSAASIRAGFDDYQSWMSAWIPTSLGFHVAVGLVLLFILYRERGIGLALLGSSLWLFSRWPLALYKSGQIDSIGILFFVLSIACLKRRFLWALFFFGLSLSVKQMAAFALPLYLLWTYEEYKKRDFKFLLQAAAAFALLPILLVLPFMLWDIESFFRMLIFPLTRAPRGANSVDIFLGLPGILGKIPFFGLLALTYFLAWKKRINCYTALFLSMFITLSFNAVFFTRYFCWAIPLLSLQLFGKEEAENSV